MWWNVECNLHLSEIYKKTQRLENIRRSRKNVNLRYVFLVVIHGLILNFEACIFN